MIPVPPKEEKLPKTIPEELLTNSIGMTFVPIPEGTFLMGSPRNEPKRVDDEAQHRVTITKPFYLQTTEVTQGQWKKVMRDNSSCFKDCGDDCPVEQVSWNDAQEFIKRLNKMENAGKYRLPTEAEWECACRAGSTTAFSSGDNVNSLRDYGWYLDNSERRTHPVGQKKPNAWGLYDTHGNVWEWCHDWYRDYPSGEVSDPKGPPTGDFRVLRGGSLYNNAWNIRSANRDRALPDLRGDRVGFRVASDF